MSCPCDSIDSFKNFKKGLIFAVIQKLMDNKIINKLEKPIENVETGKVTSGKTMKLNIMIKTVVYVVASYIIDMFKNQILQQAVKVPMIGDKIIKDGKVCFCALEDLILVIILTILSAMYHKRLKGKDLLNNIIAVYGSSYLYDAYGKQYLGFIGSGELPFSTVGEKTSTSTTNQGGETRNNLTQSSSQPGKRSL